MITSGTLRGVEGRVVVVTARRSGSALPSLALKGLADAAEREARVRVQAALANAGEPIGGGVEVVCESGGISIDGCGIDLPAALAVASGALDGIGAVGELSLGGEVRPVRGVLPIVEAMRERARVVLVAAENATEAALVDGVRIVPVKTLREALEYARGKRDLPAQERENVSPTRRPDLGAPDLQDVVGQERARRAIEVAAAGGHSVLFVGPPGTGKTMLARRLPGLLPAMTEAEKLDVTRVHSAAGLNIGGGLVERRPFRAPHHSTTPAELVGGGARTPRPGEVTLAHHGVLFLDELPEFARAALEVLDEPLATGEVLLARASGTLRFPSRTLVVASMTPCPCGRLGTSSGRRCYCSNASCTRYLARIPEQLLARFDLRVSVDPIDTDALADARPREDSATVRARVVAARTRLESDVAHDARKLPWEASCAHPLAKTCATGAHYERTLRVAATIAALAGSDSVRTEHVEEAALFTKELADVAGVGVAS